jgi:hypothetical protein
VDAQVSGPELTNLLKEELTFWKNVGPRLKEGWWNGSELPWKEVEKLRARYMMTSGIVEGLKSARFTECRETVTAFRDFWRSLRQLGGVESDQLGAECDAVLRELEKRILPTGGDK